MCYNSSKEDFLMEDAVEEKKILCPDCGKFLFKIAEGSSATVICWCRLCRQEKRIEYRAIEPNVQR